MKPKKIKSISQLKKKAWKVVSLFVRKRDSNEQGYGHCCTCGRLIHYTQGDAGHFLSGRMNGILFDVRGIHLQCKPCNGGFRNQKFSRDDVAINYRAFMKVNYGEDVIKDLERLQRTVKQWKVGELEEIIKKYTLK